MTDKEKREKLKNFFWTHARDSRGTRLKTSPWDNDFCTGFVMDGGDRDNGYIYISKIDMVMGWKDIKGVYKLLYCPGDDKLKYIGSSKSVFLNHEFVAEEVGRRNGVIENASKLIETIKLAGQAGAQKHGGANSGGGKKNKSKKTKRRKRRKRKKTKKRKRRKRKKTKKRRK
tara:strand:- start:286 stop:801 length:516 start_codon:yes stop_codon:yes gene_type:complete